MVSTTFDFVSVVLVIDPWVKLGTTGTACAAPCSAPKIKPRPIDSDNLDITIYPTYLIVSSEMNCPVAEVPAPPAVNAIVPAESIVPASAPAVPPEYVEELPCRTGAAN